MKRSMLSLTALLTAALTGAALAQQPASTFTVVRPTQWGAYNLNPFAPGDQHLLPTNSVIYESLFYVSTLNGKVTPVLGTKYAWSKDNKTLTVTTRGGVTWHDGKPFSANDVAFTFNYLKQFPALDTSGLWKNGLTSVKATNANTVTFNFNKANTPIFQYVAGQMIVPQHIWANVKDPVTDTNQKAVGTGPFTFDSYSQQALRVLKNPNYWMKGQPYVDAVVWLATNSNDAALLKLLKGEADYGYVGVSDPKGMYASKGPNNQYWWPVTGDNYLYFNTTKAPFNDAAFRRAVSQAINTADVAQKAYAGVAKPSHPSGIIPAQQAQWLPANASSLAVKFNAAAADAALTKAGYRKNAQGARLGKDGKALPAFKILVGAGWTDFITMAQVISENLKKVGINTQIDQQAWSSYSGGLQTANYDMGISWGWGGGPTPYYLYYQSFSPEFSAAVGKTAPSNLAHYSSPAITQALAQYRATSDAAAQKKAIGTIATTVMRDMPWLPLTDRSEFSLYSTARFTGFPNAQNPYNAGTADDTPGARLMYLNVKPKK
ncbi:ABC transporter substrate-binding protein [Deinococcus maricopensis]|uniref:ABC-type transporter, periplasmic subunit n=1 Tax=Deinococcus maricopensis (strain DSM 21211 / LMG 22137 / NRRL B-23946 / LB-34) TaxID=709986 RepID=E8U462_DEIML|nr:ABC transporter substrate-binding protein [Deinococcus maricopensis]ADV65899.1 ABC-type transporter, periplasmic subunit [Deinococcus maricopensis DSM 21211]